MNRLHSRGDGVYVKWAGLTWSSRDLHEMDRTYVKRAGLHKLEMPSNQSTHHTNSIYLPIRVSTSWILSSLIGRVVNRILVLPESLLGFPSSSWQRHLRKSTRDWSAVDLESSLNSSMHSSKASTTLKSSNSTEFLKALNNFQ